MKNKGKFINVSEPSLSKLEERYVKDALKSGFISGTTGRYIKEFEEGFAKFCRTEFSVSCNSGTAALQLAVRTAGIKEGDEVIVPTFTSIATILCVIYAGATPVLIDSRKDTWCMDESLLESKITHRTKAVMPVHIYGHPVKMDTVMKIAKKHSLIVIEDAAEAHGGMFDGKPVGSIGQMGCFSFYGNKILTTGEGGMVTTSNAEYAAKMRSLRNLAFGDAKRYIHTDLGYNYRMTNIQAAIGLGQLQRADELISKKRAMAATYNKALAEVKGVHTPVELPWAKNVYWMYGILLDERFRMGRDQLMAALYERGIDTRSFFVPLHKLPMFHALGLFKEDSHPVSEMLGRNGLYLPSGANLKKSEILYICKTIKDLSKQ